VTMNLTDDSSASRSIPLEIEPITTAPSSAGQTVSRPPKEADHEGDQDQHRQRQAPVGVEDGEGGDRHRGEDGHAQHQQAQRLGGDSAAAGSRPG
jgi:hypothetical protein